VIRENIIDTAILAVPSLRCRRRSCTARRGEKTRISTCGRHGDEITAIAAVDAVETADFGTVAYAAAVVGAAEAVVRGGFLRGGFGEEAAGAGGGARAEASLLVVVVLLSLEELGVAFVQLDLFAVDVGAEGEVGGEDEEEAGDDADGDGGGAGAVV